MAAAAPRDPQPDEPAEPGDPAEPSEPEGREPGVGGFGSDAGGWQPRPNDFLVEPMFAPFEGGAAGAGDEDEDEDEDEGGPGAHPASESGAGPERSPVPGVDGPSRATGGPADGRRSPWAWIRGFLGF